MKLLPSLRSQKRYIVFEIIAPQQFTLSDVAKEVESALLLFLGQLGVSKAAPLFVKEKYKNNRFIVKVSNRYSDECKAAVILITTIKNVPVVVKSVATSGTLKKASARL
ncbi:MAG: Rpp14/Pop5 family protein [Nanoarchaeota archaeon]|nr:Rpp14/Pop5 family protein [Nanoarchaeota archaeon]